MMGEMRKTDVERASEPAQAASPAPGRQRSQRAHEAVIRVTRALLESMTYDQLSVDRIAAESGVSKRTIYRWWPNKGAIVMEAAAATDVELPDTGTLRGDLVALLGGIIETVSRHRAAQAIRGLLCEAQFDPEFAVRFREYIGRRRGLCLAILERAAGRGEVQVGVEPAIVADLLYGAYWNRFLIGHAPLDRAFAEQVVDVLLEGIVAAKPSRAGARGAGNSRRRG
jgi:AcrR family transcriptional regulator